MIDYETFSRIKQLQQTGLNGAQIAQELELDPRTVGDWMKQERYRQRKKRPASSKLDPYKTTIIRLLEQHPFSAKQLYERLQGEGYQGSYSLLSHYVFQVRPKRRPAYLTLSFSPGECAQVDWGQYKTITVGNTQRQLNFFVMVLCHSRMIYVEFTLSQSMEHFLACHQHAFDYFGGVPKAVMIDNLKTGVLRRNSEQIVYHPKYLDFANHYGFTIKACNVRKGNEKGRVESGVGYVKKNFLNGLALTRFEALAPAIRDWMDSIANVRTHGETRKRPCDLLAEDRQAMHRMNPNHYDIARIESVRSTKLFRIAFEANRYSVPAEYASCRLQLKIYPDRLCIYTEEKLIARHIRSFERHRDIEDPDHPKALLAQRRSAREQQLYQRFIALSPKAADYYQQMAQKRANVAVHLRKIVALSERYGTEATARALEDAFAFGAFSSDYISNLLEQRQNPLPQPAALHLTRNEDLLQLTLEEADLSIYSAKGGSHHG